MGSKVLDSLRFGFVLRDVSRLYVQRFEQRASAIGLTLPQCKVLLYLVDREGISQAKLGELTDIEPMTLMRILNRMEADGWLERRSDQADRRARRLYLKAKARPLVDYIWQLMDLTREEGFAGISAKQVRLLIASLGKVRKNLAALGPLPATPAAPLRHGEPARSLRAQRRTRRQGTVSQL